MNFIPAYRRIGISLCGAISMSRSWAVLVGALAAAGCSEPFVTIPGGELAGADRQPPDAWRDIPDTIQLETRPADPYSINIWGVGIGSELYVATSGGGTTWTAFIEDDHSVRVRIDDGLYRLQATLVEETGERGRVALAYSDKYEVDPHEGWVSEGMIFRLERP